VDETIETFSNSIDWIRNYTFTEQDLNEAKLKLFSDIDSPISPSSKGISEWKNGITFDLAQQSRMRTINVQKDDLIESISLF
jgi:presequence protease